MNELEPPDDSEKVVVPVTKHGQATIPKRFREKLGIEVPGKVVFRETEDGEIIVAQVRSPSEMRGFAARSEASTDKPASEVLREKREQDCEVDLDKNERVTHEVLHKSVTTHTRNYSHLSDYSSNPSTQFNHLQIQF